MTTVEPRLAGEETTLGQAGSECDWFESAYFTQPSVRRVVNLEIDNYLNAAREFFAMHAVDDANLHLSGSLARREPAVATGPDGAPHLQSDIDLVIVTEEDLDPLHPLNQLDDYLRSRFPKLQVLSLSVRTSDLSDVASLHGLDLWCGLRNPVVENITVTVPEPPRIGLRQRLEIMAHQVGLSLLSPADVRTNYLFRNELPVHKIKLQLEGLRCLLPQCAGEPLRYADTLRHGVDTVRNVAGEATIARLVESRELGKSPIHDHDAFRLPVTSVKHLLGIDAGDHTDRDLVVVLRDLAVHHPHSMNIFQFGLLFLLILLHSHDSRMPLEIADAFTAVFKSCDRAPSDRMSMRRVDPEAMRWSLSQVRGEYYEMLKHHNNGRKTIGGYSLIQ